MHWAIQSHNNNSKMIINIIWMRLTDYIEFVHVAMCGGALPMGFP